MSVIPVLGVKRVKSLELAYSQPTLISSFRKLSEEPTLPLSEGSYRIVMGEGLVN